MLRADSFRPIVTVLNEATGHGTRSKSGNSLVWVDADEELLIGVEAVGGIPGSFELAISPEPRTVENDLFVDRIDLGISDSFVVHSTNQRATQEDGEPETEAAQNLVDRIETRVAG